MVLSVIHVLLQTDFLLFSSLLAVTSIGLPALWLPVGFVQWRAPAGVWRGKREVGHLFPCLVLWLTRFGHINCPVALSMHLLTGFE